MNMMWVILSIVIISFIKDIYLCWYLFDLEKRLDKQKKLRDIQIDIQNLKINEIRKYINKL
ncbi:hypothetical protein [Bacillus cereus]|uniref:hypothetical protein n=1 Tax=Bacillus cereus TaxID=1396 RepID=UPI000BFA6DA3|nr:hypothetical protein [Bacillus cereus]PFB70598.1 hypothetical protein CN291_02195 [Bacillus cereus]PFR50572.1 hypothetical protein COK35_11165 [Bacillus cereus]